MASRAEDVLFASLTDIDALETLASVGLDPLCIPTEVMRPVVAWALDYYFEGNRKQAPTREMLVYVWGDVLEAEEIELPDEDQETDTIESALATLKDHYAHREYQQFIKSSAAEMANALPMTKAETLTTQANLLFEVVARLQDHSAQVGIQDAFPASLADYERRVEEGHAHRGMTFGLEPVDEHTYGIHPGELAVLAGGPKVGKSYFAVRVALHEWAVRSHRTVLFTLENTVEMMQDRIACLHLDINARDYQRGQVPPEQIEQVRKFINEELGDMTGDLQIIAPPRGARTPEMLIREARMRGADSVIVDQLTHVEHPNPARKARHELFNENVHDFADLIKQGRDRLPLLVLHQINRAGMESAKVRKPNAHEMHHMAESAGVERAASWVFSLYRNYAMRSQHAALLQVLASRREDVKAWDIAWGPRRDRYRVVREAEVDV
jgi:replicative DNA helicase